MTPPSNSTTPAAPVTPGTSPAQPTYDSGLRFDSGVRYANTTVPSNDGALVKFSPSSMTDTELLNFAVTENTDMTDNPNFSAPMPPVADVAAGIAAYSADLDNLRQIRSNLRDGTATKDTSRANLEALLRVRAGYVQAASNGNANVIISGGFAVRNAPTPVGNLDAPMNVNLTLNGTPGMMYMDWLPVMNARAYNVQISPADTLARDWQPYRTTTTVRLMLQNLELGKTYALRVAAVGGASGLSPWSIEAVRMAA